MKVSADVNRSYKWRKFQSTFLGLWSVHIFWRKRVRYTVKDHEEAQGVTLNLKYSISMLQKKNP